MRNNWLRWILLFTLVWASQTLQQQSCRESDECSCILMPPDEYEIRCPKYADSTFIVKVQIGEIAVMTCNRMPSWSDFKVEPATEVQDVNTFKFERCSLPPGKTLHEITRMIGVQPKNKLRFESYGNLSSTLEQRHLSGFPTLEQLSLSANSLTYLPVDLLKELPELTVLELRENNVVLPVGIFNSVPKLRMLELGNNKLTHIDPLLFRNLENLRSLGLWGNQLINIEEHTFDGLIGLRLLDISRNNLITLPADVFKPLKNLTNLSLISNNFSSLPSDLLSKNLNLETLSLNNNRGRLTLPSRFLSNLPKLGDVNLMSNNFTELPEDIFWGSTALRNLTLNRNSFTTLPKNIFNESKSLRLLNLSSNKFTTLPIGLFTGLNKLEILDLQRNRITFISESFFIGLTGLRELNLEHNGLTALDKYSFYPLTSLKVARLSYNELNIEPVYVPDLGTYSPFSTCTELRELHLSYNNITEIYTDWGFVLLKLQKIDLRYNRIGIVSAADLQFGPRNIEIDIRHNNISYIDLQGAETLAKSQDNKIDGNVRVLIGDNPIVCDCRLYYFLKYLEGRLHPSVQKMYHIIPDNLLCDRPEMMHQIPVSQLKSQTLMCSDNDCPLNCACWSRPEDTVKVVNCSFRSFTTSPKSIDARKIEHIELDLTGNFLTEMPSFDQSKYGNITKLFLSHNNISRIPIDAVSPLLEILDLSNNNLTHIDDEVVNRLINSTSLKQLRLGGNPWKCDCEARSLLSFIQDKFEKIPDKPNMTCTENNKPLATMTVSDLCPVAVGMIVGVSFGIALLGVLIGILAALYYRYQAEVKVWLYAHQMCLRFVTEEELDKGKLYDAFISYSHKDEEFVVNELIPKLEQGPKPFKLCLHFRDWMAGEWIPEQIARSVDDSKRTIVILSPNFLESVWGRMEFRTAHSQALSEGRARVIVILFGDVGPTDNLDPELKAYLSMNTYVEWGDPWFWDKLRYALPHAPQARKKNANKIFEHQQHHIKLNGDKNGLINPPGVPATPPAVTTPPADSLKTFTSNGSLAKGVLITDCLKNGVANFNGVAADSDRTQKTSEFDNNLINAQCTPV